ncbi:hypothetical protein GGC65_003055 [Sphingopyxis sp. OAS728]|uniref:pilus assembly protein TadG-related protein n=1 Tax=Sphingopyxis sp. OAS728 TaxID=2663823 RepID=UPI00178AF5CF|nr:pilus assembly protein TadG-related protein [Sphingopyxis sp. OAS728]MBE1528599.1 hypothetical protein [Sphingopyxis sp. OAS728]
MTKIFPQLSSATPRAPFLSRLKADQKGGVYMIMGFAIIPLTFILGFGVDYARAMSLQTKLNAAADAAALAAVAPAMILQSNGQSRTAATNMFNAQASLETGYEDLVVNPVVTEGSSASGGAGAVGYLRKATVSYRAKSINMFGGILGVDTLTVSGISSASAAQPPNVDFYLVMDNSPSMLLPSTSDGITRIINATKNTTDTSLPNGCAFACHMQASHTDNIYIKDTNGRHILLSTNYYTANSPKKNVFYRWDKANKRLYDSNDSAMNTSTTKNGVTTTVTYSLDNFDNSTVVIKKSTKVGNSAATTVDLDSGYWADGYWLTHNYGLIYGSPAKIVLRKDDVVSAATQLIPFAANQATQYQVTYRAQMFSFDWKKSTNGTAVQTLNALTNVNSYGSNFSSLFPGDDYWWKNSEPTKGVSNDDRATDVTGMLTVMNNINTIPAAGTGAPGAVPQKILFIISDGMLDQPANSNGSGRYFGPLRDSDLTLCTAIKAKGIKIAVLYTKYLPESLVGDAWSQSNIAPFLPPPPSPYARGNAGSSDQVLTKLQSCASVGTNGAPLVQTVTANDNITTALQQLFSTALQTARLVQ